MFDTNTAERALVELTTMPVASPVTPLTDPDELLPVHQLLLQRAHSSSELNKRLGAAEQLHALWSTWRTSLEVLEEELPLEDSPLKQQLAQAASNAFAAVVDGLRMPAGNQVTAYALAAGWIDHMKMLSNVAVIR